MLKYRRSRKPLLTTLRYRSLDTLCEVWPFDHLPYLKAWRTQRVAEMHRILAGWVERGPWHYYAGGPPTPAHAEPQEQAGGNE